MKVWLVLLLLGLCLSLCCCKPKHNRKLKIKGVSLDKVKKHLVGKNAHYKKDKNSPHQPAVDPHDTESRLHQEDWEAFMKAYGSASRKKIRKNHNRHTKDKVRKRGRSRGRYRRAVPRQLTNI